MKFAQTFLDDVILYFLIVFNNMIACYKKYIRHA